MSVTRRRVARKNHLCGSHLCPVRPGDDYLEHTVFPGDDILEVTHPHRLVECAACATRHGRAHLLEPTP